jgi:hypothetical protein
MRRLGVFVLVGFAASVAGSGRAAPVSTIHVVAFASTGIRLADVLWTGKQFLYVANTTNAIFAGDAAGGKPRPFAKLPRIVEETRCVVSPGGHGFPKSEIYCHVPDNRIFEVSPDGSSVRLFAALPTLATSDGAIAFDRVGRFGYRLVVATGRSGSPTLSGGVVYTVDAAGTAREVGTYRGAGGADEVAIAPAGFGSVAGWALLTVDPGPNHGIVLAISPSGRARTVARLTDGPNPIAVIPAAHGSAGASPGFYVSDTATRDVFELPGSALASYAGAVIVGTELQARFFVIRPRGGGFAVTELKTDLAKGQYNLEGADYVP